MSSYTVSLSMQYALYDWPNKWVVYSVLDCLCSFGENLNSQRGLSENLN